MAKVRGTQDQKPLELEFGKTTVYERKNIRRVDETDTDERRGFHGWEYDEEQYDITEWYKQDSIKNKLAIAELAELIAGGTDNG
ncbi:MAG: hypothetical protein NC184_05740 [Roseburia sp.]|nr:hypothetical protein [Ruminococcus flavefaciens]MCM1368236.1 hypothetical protein [Roseburia sp.]MCM1368290.1 hypothetical protein [Roseburia sp.]